MVSLDTMNAWTQQAMNDKPPDPVPETEEERRIHAGIVREVARIAAAKGVVELPFDIPNIDD